MTGNDLSHRLLKRVPPHPRESLRSYLMRTAVANGRSNADRVLVESLGLSGITISPALALRLADYCRCDASEFLQLSGIEYRATDGTRYWKIEGQRVTKDFLVRASRQALCPGCIQKYGYLRARWDLTLYAACPEHACQLLDKCPQCRRLISPHRAALTACNCGFLFSDADVAAADDSLLLAAALIDHAITAGLAPPLGPCQCLETKMLERLAAMSLDTLLKSLWFFGLVIAECRDPGVGRGRRRRGVDAASTIVRDGMSQLANWPAGFLSALERIRMNSHAAFAPIETSLFAQVRNYLEDEFRSAPESNFVAAAYDRFIADWWASKGKAPHSRFVSAQMELF